jgi:hypothetical protein
LQQTTNIPKPLPPRDECLQDGKHVLRAKLAGSDVLCCYDEQRQSAATYHAELQLWRIQVPLSLHEYLQALVTAGFDLPGGSDFVTWITAVTGKNFSDWIEDPSNGRPS